MPRAVVDLASPCTALFVVQTMYGIILIPVHGSFKFASGPIDNASRYKLGVMHNESDGRGVDPMLKR